VGVNPREVSVPKLVPVSREHHAGKAWRRFSKYTFAASEAIAPLVGAELAKAALAMPIAFLQESGRYLPAALMSLVPGHNLFVGPAGQWLGSYVPATYRAYPFRFARREGSQEVTLCIDEDSGLVVEDSASGEKLFDADGNASPALKSVLDFLTAIERSRKATELAVAALAQASVIRPWDIKVKAGEQEKPVQGLYRVDEDAMSKLSDAEFLKLRRAGALSFAYAQLLSVGQLAVLQHLVTLQGQLAPAQAAVATLPESIDSLLDMPSDETVRFR
jgi:hypothetical protein